jgi:hypothetical protein
MNKKKQKINFFFILNRILSRVQNYRQLIETQLNQEKNKVVNYELLVKDCLNKLEENNKKTQDYVNTVEVMKQKINEQTSLIV